MNQRCPTGGHASFVVALLCIALLATPLYLHLTYRLPRVTSLVCNRGGGSKLHCCCQRSTASSSHGGSYRSYDGDHGVDPSGIHDPCGGYGGQHGEYLGTATTTPTLTPTVVRETGTAAAAARMTRVARTAAGRRGGLWYAVIAPEL